MIYEDAKLEYLNEVKKFDAKYLVFMQMEKKETHKFSVVNNAPTIYRPQEEW
jgi:hypothetical protein